MRALKDIKLFIKKNNTILLSPASASFDQFLNFEKRGEKFKNYLNIMQENTFNILLINYWRNIDKKIFFCFILLFFLAFFFILFNIVVGRRKTK